MSWPTIAKCYDDIAMDPSLLWLFPEECTSIQELPLLGTLWFRIISERLFICITSPAIWGKARMEFITSRGWKISREAIPMVILVTDGVEEGNLGMVTTLCHNIQAKMEVFWCTLYPTSAWLAKAKCGCSEEVHQHSLYPSRVLPSPLSRCEHSLWGALPPPNSHWTGYIYIDCSPFLTLRWSCLKKREGWGWNYFPHFWEALWQNSEEEHNPISLSVPYQSPSRSRREHPDGGRIRLSPSPQASTRCQSCQSSVGVWVGPGNTAVASKIWQ